MNVFLAFSQYQVPVSGFQQNRIKIKNQKKCVVILNK